MHTEAYTYTREALARCGGAQGKAILEIGSININGSARDLCAGHGYYYGIDKVPGPGVDLVIDARDFEVAPIYDLVICNEVLEHDPEPAAVLACAARCLRDGGHLILTCAGTGRKPHSADGSEHPHESEHYANVHPNDLALDLLHLGLDLISVDYLAVPGDTRCIARRPVPILEARP